jgi:DNA invertase Pin-like site-specific DNA recombinase
MIQIQNNYQSLEADNILSLLEKFRHPGKGSNHTKRKKRNLRVLIYIRKSVIVIGAVHYSPEEQERECRAYAERQGWEVVAVIYDLDETGRNADRDGFQEGLNLVRTGEIDIFLTMYVDRTYRNGFKFPIFIDFLDKYKVRLVSVNENFDTGTFHGRLIAIVLGVIAEWPIWSSSLRTRGAKHARVRDGLTNANFRLGYCNGLCSRCSDPNGENYCPLFGGPDRAQYSGTRIIMVPHPIERFAIILIVHLYRRGWSDKEIAHQLNHFTFTLPNGQIARFRTKGVPSRGDNGYEPGPFTRDSVRTIVTSLFYVGWVTYAESAPLSMEDNLEHPEQIPGKKHHPRHPDEISKGLHEALYPFELWMENQQIRATKARTPTNAGKPTHTYLLSDGIGFCWECYQHDSMRRASLRGSSTGKNGQHTYRCATLHERHKSRKQFDLKDAALTTMDIAPAGTTDFMDLIACHTRSTLPAIELERQAEDLLSNLTLSPEMMEQVAAYYLSDDGMGEFILKKKNLFREIERAQTQHNLGLVDDSYLEARRDHVLAELEKLKPAARPEAQEILPLLTDFPALWAQMTPLEKRAILKDVFAGLYYDGTGKLHEAKPYAPFVNLL